MANKLFQSANFADVEFLPVSQAQDVIFELDGLGTGAGRQSATWDRGVGSAATSRRYVVRPFFQLATAGTVGESVRFYLKFGSAGTGSNRDNDDGTGDAAVSDEDKLRNLEYIGSIGTDEAAANIKTSKGFEVEISAELVQVVVWNGTTDAFTTDETENGVLITPVPPELQ